MLARSGTTSAISRFQSVKWYLFPKKVENVKQTSWGKYRRWAWWKTKWLERGTNIIASGAVLSIVVCLATTNTGTVSRINDSLVVLLIPHPKCRSWALSSASPSSGLLPDSVSSALKTEISTQVRVASNFMSAKLYSTLHYSRPRWPLDFNGRFWTGWILCVPMGNLFQR